jgi:hypothetical protein
MKKIILLQFLILLFSPLYSQQSDIDTLGYHIKFTDNSAIMSVSSLNKEGDYPMAFTGVLYHYFQNDDNRNLEILNSTFKNFYSIEFSENKAISSRNPQFCIIVMYDNDLILREITLVSRLDKNDIYRRTKFIKQFVDNRFTDFFKELQKRMKATESLYRMINPADKGKYHTLMIPIR